MWRPALPAPIGQWPRKVGPGSNKDGNCIVGEGALELVNVVTFILTLNLSSLRRKEMCIEQVILFLK